MGGGCCAAQERRQAAECESAARQQAEQVQAALAERVEELEDLVGHLDREGRSKQGQALVRVGAVWLQRMAVWCEGEGRGLLQPSIRLSLHMST